MYCSSVWLLSCQCKSQIHSVTRTCYMHIHMLKKLKKHLTAPALHMLVHAFIISRLDYANSLYYGIPDYLIAKLQRVQNMAARLIHSLRYDDPITAAFIQLHWLPIRQRICYKIAVLTYKCGNDTAPKYLSSLLEWTKPTRLRSSDTKLLKVTRTRLKYAGDRSFRVAAPRIWNNLPHSVRHADSITVFKSKLKYHLFQQAYSISI